MWARRGSGYLYVSSIFCDHVSGALSGLLNCTGNGTLTASGGCDCDTTGPIGDNGGPWVGPSCSEYSAGTTCSGRGLLDPQHYNCTCTPSDRGAFYGNYTGPDCSGDPQLLIAEQEESRLYAGFYIASGVIATLFLFAVCVVLCSGMYESRSEEREFRYEIFSIPIIALFRLYDFMSDWAFYAITLREDGLFYYTYRAEGGDYEAFHNVACLVCVVGIIILVIEGAINLFNGAMLAEGKLAMATPFTLIAVLTEDAPQLVLQTMYFDVVGFENADTIALTAFYMSIISIGLNGLSILTTIARLIHHRCKGGSDFGDGEFGVSFEAIQGISYLLAHAVLVWVYVGLLHDGYVGRERKIGNRAVSFYSADYMALLWFYVAMLGACALMGPVALVIQACGFPVYMGG